MTGESIRKGGRRGQAESEGEAMAAEGEERPWRWRRAAAAVVLLVVVVSVSVQGSVASSSSSRSLEGTIAFATVGRAHYAFDIFCLPAPAAQLRHELSSPLARRRMISAARPLAEARLTDGESVNYNGHFASDAEKASLWELLLLAAKNSTTPVMAGSSASSHGGGGAPPGPPLARGQILAFVSERRGRAQIFFNLFLADDDNSSSSELQSVELHTPADDLLLPFLRDRPSIANSSLIHISSQDPSPSPPPRSSTAVFSTHLSSGLSTRLTPTGIADYSPSVSPSGEWVLVASHGDRGWQGEVHELGTDLYIFKASDGSQRRLLVQDGGWPSWADDSTFFFHRKAEDGWWSIYRGIISDGAGVESVLADRITPAGVHCFTPAASRTMEWIAVATRRPESEYRHIEIFDLQSNSFLELTNSTTPFAHHYNPFVSSDSTLVGYHRCRGETPELTGLDMLQFETDPFPRNRQINRRLKGVENAYSPPIPRLQHVASPFPELSLVRVDGSFPSFSPDGSLIAYIPNLDEGGVNVMRLDGSGSTQIYTEPAFGTVWDRKRDGVVYTSSGPIFASEQSTVHIVAIFNASRLANGEDIPLVSKVLTKEGSRNNAFPYPSPDGKYVVFRSGRSGYKNLYIMDAVNGEEGGIWRLTEGEWTDTMCSWSPDGEWIVFSSDRDNPGGASFALYLIHPNGTGLHKVFDGVGTRGRANHAAFSPDSKTLLFTSNFAGPSAEPISEPHQFQPYGEIFLASLDGSYLERLTHNAYEDGTPSWGMVFISASELSKEGEQLQCSFDDATWLNDAMASPLHHAAC